MDIYERLRELNIEIPKPNAPLGLYSPAKVFGEKFIYISGQIPIANGTTLFVGKVGKEVSLEEGQKAAYICMINILSALNDKIKDLNRVKSVVKILGFVASSDDFYDQPKVINAASQLLVDVFGEDIGKASRSAVGTNALPGNVPVEIEALFEII